MSTADSTPTKPSRESLLTVLIEAGLGLAAISEQLVAASYTGMTAEEIKAHAEHAACVDSALAELQVTGPSKKEVTEAAKAVGEFHKGKEPKVSESVALPLFVQLRHRMVDLLRAVYPDKYAEYHAIKYPGGVESMATAETRDAAYKFAFAFLMSKTLA